MTRYVVDAKAVIELARREIKIAEEDKLLAPTLLRSQTLSILHECVARGDISEADALERLARIGKLPIRLLGDAVLRRRAWKIANQLGWK
jgi:predicted nucleic acid-binding protein